ncbi:MAG TPA: tripartite tricarboxylate transporter substrate binding protein [Burkholderiales bacterium]|jgi:tripartite-type tricarboxylate transporter receptor subunit TctC|nr:tripartite tricarboxylate transporter substrate binding protein [Burkholderiales bacterium]
MRPLFNTLLAAAMLAMSGAALAQAYPAKPITFVVPYTPGTGIDIVARTVGPRLSQKLGQPILVDNRPGASGNIGADYVAKSRPDGYTVMVNVNTFTITPSLYKNVPYDPVKDFATITEAARGNISLVAFPGTGVKTLPEFVAKAKAEPGKLTYSSPGSGTPQHLAMEVLKQRLGLDIQHIPYKGAAGATTDLLGGQVQFSILPVHTALPHARTGKLNLVAVSGEKRSVLAPDVPTFSELGQKNLGLDLYFWFAAPAGTPRDVVMTLNREIGAILAMPEVRETMLKQGLVPESGTPEEIAGEIKSDLERWKKFIAETHITAD